MASDPVVVSSLRPRVQFKGQRRWGADLSQALGLRRHELCRELSRYDCLDDVHRIALGGVEPYALGIDEPLAVLPVTAAIAVDRVALQACMQRVDRDLDPRSDDALIFGALRGGDSPSRRVREDVSAALYRRLLSRDARAEEVAALADFWTEVEVEGVAEPIREWATMTCFAVASSIESLFY
ncbi:MAG: hypothetical protein AAFV29_16190 [Myxococcota bacterium]